MHQAARNNLQDDSKMSSIHNIERVAAPDDDTIMSAKQIEATKQMSEEEGEDEEDGYSDDHHEDSSIKAEDQELGGKTELLVKDAEASITKP